MKIAYIGRHGQANSNQDEEAVVDGLTKLGHEVETFQETTSLFEQRNPTYFKRFDFILFNKWYDTNSMERLKALGIKLVFWYWDLVDWPSDPTLSLRCQGRKRWMTDVTPLVNLGFCTDGDWVVKDKSGKLRWLLQGADQRNYGIWDRVELGPEDMPIDILFAGQVKGCGMGRADFHEWMTQNYGTRYKNVTSGFHGLELAKLVKRSRIIVCPPSPVTDHYWSNRAYLLGSMGAFIFHPLSKGLDAELSSSICWYSDLRHLARGIRLASDQNPIMPVVKAALIDKLYSHSTYQHRCEVLVRTVQESL